MLRGNTGRCRQLFNMHGVAGFCCRPGVNDSGIRGINGLRIESFAESQVGGLILQFRQLQVGLPAAFPADR